MESTGNRVNQFDDKRVRIELCDVMTLTDGNMTGKQAAEIWLAGELGKVSRWRKPDARLIADTRPELLRQLATWIEQRDDPGLCMFASHIQTLGQHTTTTSSRDQFACPNCGQIRWHAELYLPGGLRVTCIPCGWNEEVTEIERRMKAGEL